jgi:hypothetical protein
MYAIAFPVFLQIYLVTSFVVVAFEGSARYGEAAVVVIVGTLVVVYVWVLPGIAGRGEWSSPTGLEWP